MRSNLLALAFLVLMASPAMAQLVGNDTAPGDSCAGKPPGATRMTADPDQDGKEVVLICDGSIWRAASEPAADPDRGIQFNSGGNLTADANLIYNSAGNLGMGTSTPSAVIDIEKSGMATNANLIELRESGDIVFAVTARDGGTIAMGPSRDFSVCRKGTGSCLKIDNAGLRAVDHGTIRIESRVDNGGPGHGIRLWNDSLLPSGTPLLIAGASSNEYFRIADTGNIGIGTTTPNANVQIVSTNDASLKLGESTANYGELFWDKSANHFIIHNKLSDTSVGSLLMSEDGRFVLNSGTPSATLEIVRADISHDYLMLSSPGPGNGNVFIVKNDGNVGVGNAAPEALLDVAGEVKVGNTGSSCVPATEGALRYSTANSCMELCDGLNWACMQAASCPNSLPDAFSFSDVTGATTSTQYTSNIQQVTGVTGCTVEVSISGLGSPEYQTCSDGSSSANCDGSVIQDWTSNVGSIQNNEYIRMRLTSSASGGEGHNADIVIGARADRWNVTTQGDCSDPNPPVPTTCSDGTIYIGAAADGTNKLFRQGCAYGQNWDGVQCTGSPIGAIAWSDVQVSTGTVSGDGPGNTTTLVGLPDSYPAAEACDSMTQHGHSDWYLPARGEQTDLICSINHLGSNKVILTSTESGANDVFHITTNSCGNINNTSSKLNASDRRVVCVRRAP